MTGAPPLPMTAKPEMTSGWQRAGPIITLILLPAVIAELLFGAIRITTLFALIPATGAWGCGALLIRDIIRRGGRGWASLGLMAAALAVAEECVIQQTSFTPLVGVDPNHVYGRAFGVNWVYLLWAVGYESVWAVIIPILLAELLFPNRREAPWLRRRGLTIASFVFLGASFVAWYFWTQIFVPQFFPESAYVVPLTHAAAAFAAIGLLVAAAISLRPVRKLRPSQSVQRPWLAGVAGFIVGTLWFTLVLLAFGAAPSVPPAIPLVSGIAAGSVSLVAVHVWNKRFGWGDVNVLALIMGAVTACMLTGFLVLYGSGAPPIDFVGKVVLNVLAGSALAVWLMRLLKSPPPSHADGEVGTTSSRPPA